MAIVETELLSRQEVRQFHEQGYLIKRGFYGLATEIEPIQAAIHRIIGLVIAKNRLPIEHPPFQPATFDAGFQQLIAANRRLGAEIYDAVKQIPAFVRLAANVKHDQITCQLRDTDAPGVAGGGFGIRIDNPREEQFRAPWHQDYPAQFRSLDGLVFWSPLASVTREMGPVEICVGSHKDGLIRVHTKDPKHPEKKAAYALILENEDQVIARYPHVAPLSEPGDLLIFDFLTVHRSGLNASNRSRWSMQNRYFNFVDPTGMKMSWAGSFAAGSNLREIHPDLFID